jgi:O-antigen/teichoic acid export membrane protein
MSKQRLIALFMRVVGAGGSALLAFTIAKLTDPSFLGEFQYFLTIALGLAILARVGLDRGVVRYIAKSTQAEETQQIMNASLRVIFKKSLLILVAMLIILLILYFTGKINNTNTFVLFSFPLMSLSVLISGYYKGIFKPNISFIFDMGFISLVSSIVILAISLFSTRYYVYIPLAFMFSYFLVVALGILVNKNNFFSKTKVSLSLLKDMRSSSNNFMWMTLSVYMQQLVLVLALTYYLSSYDLGLYKIAEKLAMLVGFFQAVVTAIYSPYFSKLYHSGKLTELTQYARKASNMSLVLSLPSLMIIAIFSKELLNLFGQSYTEASTILIILAVAQFVNVILGPAAMILNQTEYEKISRNIVLLFSMLSLPLITIACHLYGTIGGASMILIISLLQNLSFYFYVYKRMNILVYPSLSLRSK